MLNLDRIRIDGGTQARVELNAEVVSDYSALYKAGVQMPAVKVFFDGSAYWLADGFHRYFGAKDAGLTEIYEDIQPGTQRDAILHSLGANSNHGLRRTNEDKRRSVTTMLSDAEWNVWSDNEVARRCGVSQPFVSGIRATLSNNGYKIDPAKTVFRTGTEYTQNTANIGKASPAAPAPVPSPSPAITSVQIQEAVDQTHQALAKIETPPEFIQDESDVIGALHEKISELEQEIATLKLAADPDALKKIQDLTEDLRVVKTQRDDWQNKCSELTAQVKQLKRKAGAPA
jgi:hypothetical protein